MVPSEYSTGGKQKLLGISKRGNAYLRRRFVQGARVVMQYRTKQAPGLSSWLGTDGAHLGQKSYKVRASTFRIERRPGALYTVWGEFAEVLKFSVITG